MIFRIHRVLPILCCLFFASCAISIPRSTKDGSRHYVIVGLGVVSLHDDIPGVVAAPHHSLGASWVHDPSSGPRAALGYASAQSVAVSPSSENVLVEVSHQPLGDLSVTVDSQFP